MKNFAAIAVFAFTAVAAAPMATATTITFDASSCVGTCDIYGGGGALIDQGFGDTANLDVTYRLASAPGNSADATHDFGAANSLSFWLSEYSGSSAAYAETRNIKIGEVRFETLAPGIFTLNSVDIGGYRNAVRSIGLRVYDLDYNELYNISEDTFSTSLKTVALGQSTSRGLILQFGPDGFDGGIQNISYSFNTLGGLTGAAMRRRRSAIA
jgi:hypothetical protein